MASKADGRVLLPSDVEPVEYRIKLTPDMEKFTCRGEQEVDVEILEETSSVSLHSKEIYIMEASFVPIAEGGEGGEGAAAAEQGKPVGASAIFFDLKLSTATFTFPEPLAKGKGTLKLSFQCDINNQMAGFYRSGYTTVDGEKRVMASTQFEALDARRCFPCWDEPARKAVFQVTLVVPRDRMAFSNMPERVVTDLPGGKLKEFQFMPSPKMSSYLLAFCVGEFDYVQGSTKEGRVGVRVYTPPGKSHLGTFALEVAEKTLDLYDNFFQERYPLPKLDMVAIPEFAMGAMENWGLVTYREVDLLIDEAQAASQQRQRVCSVITHELAHQWFGNLVTMQWWDDLWLNEGFASWMQTYAADQLFPEWGMWQQFVVNDQQAALRLDSLRSSHPIQVPIAHAEEVEQVFDAISYCKGACVVKMLNAVLGMDMFKEGLQEYMKKHKYGNTETYDLWNAWSQVSGKDIGQMMRSWTEQMGHPLATITKETWEATSCTLEFRQSWFLADGSEVEGEEKQLWNLPLLYSTASDPKESKLEMMAGETHTLKVVELKDKDDWVKINAGQHTLMRVLYTPEMMKRLERGVRDRTLAAEDRASIVSDAYALVKAGRMGADQLVRLLPAYKEEDNSTVWKAVDSVLLGLDKILKADEAMSKRFSKLAAGLLKPIAAKVGWEPKDTDGHSGKLLRATVIELLATFSADSTEVQKEAQERFAAHIDNPKEGKALPSEYAIPVYKIVLKAGGQEEYDQLMGLLEQCDNQAERKMVYGSIGSTPTAALKKQVLEWSVSSVKLQDFFYPLNSVASSGKLGQDLAWEFFQENFERIKGMLAKASPSLMDAVILYCCGGFTEEDKMEEVKAFFEANPVPNSARKLSQMLESMAINVRFFKTIAASPLSTEAFWEGLEI
ncbi:unnamed protein product [Ectocarpus sp. 4 AP-2014]